MADNTVMESKEGLPQRQPRPRRLSRKLIIILASIFAIIIIALAVGMGVGLSRHNNPNDAGSSSTPSSTMSPIPTSSVVPTAAGLWQPPVNASWQIVLQSPLTLDLSSTSIEPNVDVWDIDMFGNSNATISHLHALNKRVICYFSAGSYEPNRPDSSRFQGTDKGLELDGWPGEYWLNLKSQNVRDIMSDRIKLAASKGCDALDPDNVDGYANKNGLGLTEEDSVDFIEFLSDNAAKYNMTIGLKNAAAIIDQVINKTAFNVNEQCAQYGECQSFAPYIEAGKPVFHIEYPKGDSTNNLVSVAISTANSICSNSGKAAGSYDFSTVIKNMNLNGWVQYCNGATAVTPCESGNNKAYTYNTVTVAEAVDLTDDGSSDS